MQQRLNLVEELLFGALSRMLNVRCFIRDRNGNNSLESDDAEEGENGAENVHL